MAFLKTLAACAMGGVGVFAIWKMYDKILKKQELQAEKLKISLQSDSKTEKTSVYEGYFVRPSVRPSVSTIFEEDEPEVSEPEVSEPENEATELDLNFDWAEDCENSDDEEFFVSDDCQVNVKLEMEVSEVEVVKPEERDITEWNKFEGDVYVRYFVFPSVRPSVSTIKEESEVSEAEGDQPVATDMSELNFDCAEEFENSDLEDFFIPDDWQMNIVLEMDKHPF